MSAAFVTFHVYSTEPLYTYQDVYIVVTKLVVSAFAWHEYPATDHIGRYQITVLQPGTVGLNTFTHVRSLSQELVTVTVNEAFHQAVIVCELGVIAIVINGLNTGVILDTIISLDALVAVGYHSNIFHPEYAYQLVKVVVVNVAITEFRVQLYHVLAHTAKYQIVVSHVGIVGLATTTHDKSTSHVFVITRNIDALSHDWRFIVGGVCAICKAGTNDATFTVADDICVSLFDIYDTHPLYAYHVAVSVFKNQAFTFVISHVNHVDDQYARYGIVIVQFGTVSDVIVNHVRSEFHVLITVTVNVAVSDGNTVCTDGEIIKSKPGEYVKHDCHAHQDA